MPRGYLWEDLSEEVYEEFHTLTTFEKESFPDVPNLKSELCWSQWKKQEAAVLPEEWRIKLKMLDGARVAEARKIERLYREAEELARQGRNKLANRKRQHAAKRARENEKPPYPDPEHRCVRNYCRRPRLQGHSLCQHHLEITRRASLKYEEKRKKKRGRGMRERLGDVRQGITHHFTITALVNGELQEIGGYIQTGEYPDGRLGEIFVKVGRVGDVYAMLDQFAVAFSVALQYGAPVESLCEKFMNTRFEPSGPTGNPDIPRCSSLVDYTARWLMQKYGKKDQT